MSDEFGVDLDEVFKVIDRRLLVDFRTKAGVLPLVKIVPRAESVEDRFRSIKRLRPEFALPEKVMSFHWPRSMPVLLTSGVWQHLVDRVSALGDDDTTETCGRTMEELMAMERREVFGAIRGADHYQTIWERQRA
jgi:hypothetical protein